MVCHAGEEVYLRYTSSYFFTAQKMLPGSTDNPSLAAYIVYKKIDQGE